MEQTEARKKQDFEKRKNNERDKKRIRILAHKKLISRVISKKYNDGMKDNAYGYMCDVSFFTNSFKNVVLEQNVMPWFY